MASTAAGPSSKPNNLKKGLSGLGEGRRFKKSWQTLAMEMPDGTRFANLLYSGAHAFRALFRIDDHQPLPRQQAEHGIAEAQQIVSDDRRTGVSEVGVGVLG